MQPDYIDRVLEDSKPGFKFIYNQKLCERVEKSSCSDCVFRASCREKCYPSKQLPQSQYVGQYHSFEPFDDIGYIHSFEENPYGIGYLKVRFKNSASDLVKIPVNAVENEIIHPKFKIGEKVIFHGKICTVYKLGKHPTKGIKYVLKSGIELVPISVFKEDLSPIDLRFKVGDQVEIRSDLCAGMILEKIEVTSLMKDYKGKKANIIGFRANHDTTNGYYLDIDCGRNLWADSMLKSKCCSEDPPVVKCSDTKKVSDSVEIGRFTFKPSPTKIVSHFKQFKIHLTHE